MTSPERWPAILLQLSSDSWVRAADLGKTIGVSESTVYREVRAMVEAGIPVRGVPGHGYQLPEEYVLSPIRLSTDEAAMLVVGSAYAARQYDGRHEAAARAAAQRIERVLPKDAEVETRSLSGPRTLARPDVFREPTDADLLSELQEAIAGENTVAVDVSTQDSQSDRRTLDPYVLVRRGMNWSVVGRDHERDRVVQFEVQSIEELSIGDETFQRPHGYGSTVATVEAPSLGPVRLAFSPEVAHSVDVPPSLDAIERRQSDDGRLLLTLQIGSEADVIPWILSWGRHAQVLEPQSLRERVAAESRAAADQYEAAPTLLD